MGAKEAKGGFFDVGLSDIFNAYNEAEKSKAEYSYNAAQQAMAQNRAITLAEKTSQEVETADITDSMYRTAGNASASSPNFSLNPYYIAGGVAVIALLFFVAKAR